MATITIDVPNKYADELGYQDVIQNPAYIPAEFDPVTFVETAPAIGEPTIPNPQSKGEFLKKKVPKIIANALADKAVKILERQTNQTLKSESEALRDTIEAAINTV